MTLEFTRRRRFDSHFYKPKCGFAGIPDRWWRSLKGLRNENVESEVVIVYVAPSRTPYRLLAGMKRPAQYLRWEWP